MSPMPPACWLIGRKHRATGARSLPMPPGARVCRHRAPFQRRQSRDVARTAQLAGGDSRPIRGGGGVLLQRRQPGQPVRPGTAPSQILEQGAFDVRGPTEACWQRGGPSSCWHGERPACARCRSSGEPSGRSAAPPRRGPTSAPNPALRATSRMPRVSSMSPRARRNSGIARHHPGVVGPNRRGRMVDVRRTARRRPVRQHGDLPSSGGRRDLVADSEASSGRKPLRTHARLSDGGGKVFVRRFASRAVERSVVITTMVFGSPPPSRCSTTPS